MNQVELNEKLRSEKSWYRDNTELVAVESVITSDLEGQVRKNGLQSSNVMDLVDSIRALGQRVPITVDEEYVAVDGNHRLEAFRQLMQQEPDGDWDKIRVYRRTFSSEEGKQQYQIKSNEHLPSKSNTENDLQDLVVKKLQKGGFGNITWDNYNNDSTNFDTLTDKVKGHFSYIKMDRTQAKKLVRLAIMSAPGSKFKNHEMKDLVKRAGCSNVTRWNGTKSRQESNGWWLPACGDAAHVSPNLIGNSLNSKVNSESVKCTVLFNCSNLEGKTAADLDKWRKDRVADVNKYNNARGVLNKKLIDEILFSPHKIESACEEKGFFKVKKKSNRTGDFDANSIPTNGWSEK